MTESPPPEFSRIFKLDEIGRLDARVHIEATPQECAALAVRFGYASIDTLAADFSLEPEDGGLSARGSLGARLAQPCIATGEPVSESVDVPFAIRFVRADADQSDTEEMEIDAQEVDTVTFSGEHIDMGEAIAETLALSVAPYPRSPDADTYLRKMGVMTEDQASPFAILAQLKTN